MYLIFPASSSVCSIARCQSIRSATIRPVTYNYSNCSARREELEHEAKIYLLGQNFQLMTNFNAEIACKYILFSIPRPPKCVVYPYSEQIKTGIIQYEPSCRFEEHLVFVYSCMEDSWARPHRLGPCKHCATTSNGWVFRR